MRPIRMSHNMLIQQNEDYEINASLQWLSPDQIQFKIIRSDRSLGINTSEYYMKPEDLMKLADLINDVLCR